MPDRRDRLLLMYSLLTHLDEARSMSSGRTHHSLECRMRTNWKVVETLLKKALDEGWVCFEDASRSYAITERGREFRAMLERALAPMYTDLTSRRR